VDIWSLVFSTMAEVQGGVVSVHAMKACRTRGGIATLFLNLGLDEGEWSNLRSGRFTPEKESWYR